MRQTISVDCQNLFAANENWQIDIVSVSSSESFDTWKSVYVLLKRAFPLFLLLSGLYTNKLLVWIIIYFLIESLCYISALIFLSDQLVKSRSYKRSILLLLIDYGKLAFDFAVIYGGFNLLGNKAQNAIDYIYFNFITSATIGYGDIYPTTSTGKIVVCFQSIIFLIFVVLVINLFTSRAGNAFKNYDAGEKR